MLYEIIAADDQISFSDETVAGALGVALSTLDAASTQPPARAPDRTSSTR
jgi:hypothetical protein